MIRFVGCLVVMSRDTHARLIAELVRARADAVDMQVRAITAETQNSRLYAVNCASGHRTAP